MLRPTRRPAAAPIAPLLAIALALAASGARAAAPADPVAARVRALVAELARDRSAPRALVPLAELEGLEDEAPDLAVFAQAYADVADDRGARPEVRAYARLRLAEVERARGNLRRSSAELDRLALLTTWQIVGPFDNEGKSGLDRVYPPEQAQDLAARYPGKVREVGWRPLPPEAVSMGFAHLGAALQPAREAVAYALAVVDAPREQRVRLYLGASGATEVFVDGALALRDPTYHVARLDQVAVALTLHPGPNRILVKLCGADAGLVLVARLTDDAGEPLRLPLRAPPLPPAAARGAAAAPTPVPGLVEALERRAEAARGARAAQARRDLAVAVAVRRPGEDRERRATAEARRAVELAPRDPEVRLLAARLEDDANRRREHLEAAVRADPRSALALTALARLELQRGRLASARALLQRARAAAPGYVAAQLAVADLHEQAGLAARAWQERAAAAREHPLHPAAVLDAARAARAQDRLDDAARLLRKALALRFDDGGARGALVSLLLDRGDVDGALRLLEEQLAVAPDDQGGRLRLADLLAANGRADAAEEAYATALRIAPEDAEALERRGQARLRAGRAQDGLADLQAALELRPQNPQLAELVRTLSPARERFERPYLQDARALAAAAPPAQQDDDALVLSEARITKVYPSGLSSSYTQLVVKVFTARGVDAWRTWATAYAPGRQEVRVDRARVLKPDGAVVETHQESDASASEPWYRLYYDTRTRQVALQSLAPGDVLEIAVRTDDVASENLLSDYFGELVTLGDGTRKLRCEYALLVPEGRRIFESDPPAGVERTERALPGGVVERRWVARDVARVRPEPYMPGWSEVTPYVHVSTYERWDDVARFYWGLVRDQLVPNREVRAAALRIASEVRADRRARGLPEAGDARALVEAVHRFVVTNTRYVALEFGIHGFKPYRVDQVLERRFGDCKDKASLTHALLEALGIDSRLVLLRMRRNGRIGERPASLAVFNHAITYVPGLDLWLDGTASYSGTRDLPAEDRGASVLVVNPGQPARFTTVPEGKPSDNAFASRYEVALAQDGSASVRGEWRVAGVQAPDYRNAYAAEHQRRASLEQAMSRAFPGLAVKEVGVSDLARLEDDVALRFAFDAPHLADAEPGGLRLEPFRARPYVPSLAPLSTRRFDLALGQPWQSATAFRYVLPAGWSAGELPPPVRLQLPFASFELAYRSEPGVVIAESRLTVEAARIAVADYPAFRDFLAQVDRAQARPLRLAPAVVPAAR